MKEWNVVSGIQIFLILLFSGITSYAFYKGQITYRDSAEILVGMIAGYRLLMDKLIK